MLRRVYATVRNMTSDAGARRRVAIIGGGPAGLSCLSQLVEIADFDVTLYERRAGFGGVWVYDAQPGACVIRYDSYGRAFALWSGDRKDGSDDGTFRPPGAMYDGLRTNLPCDVMAYRSHPFACGTPMFPDRSTVHEYIERFASQLLQQPHAKHVDVRLATAVCSVRRTSHDAFQAQQRIGSGSKWHVASTHVDSGEKSEDVFDHVVIASGRCNTPWIPTIAGLQSFTGEVIHSAWYRSPLAWQGKTVLVVGNSSSGSDIVRELSGYIVRTLPEGQAATKAYIDACNHAHASRANILHSYQDIDKSPPLDFDPRSNDAPAWAKRITVVPRIDSISHSTVVLHGGQTIDNIDVIVFATGYVYEFPYLDQCVSPFDRCPLIPPPAHQAASAAPASTPAHRTAPFLTWLDDWSLFYAVDASICVLGAPIRIVPMPFTHVQSRIVAAAWSGAILPAPGSTALPRLDPSIPTTDPTKWSTTLPHSTHTNHSSDLGYPSDTAYQNALLGLLPPHLQHPPSTQDQHSNQQQHLPPHLSHEGWSQVAPFRNEQRANTKLLRRSALGY